MTFVDAVLAAAPCFCSPEDDRAKVGAWGDSASVPAAPRNNLRVSGDTWDSFLREKGISVDQPPLPRDPPGEGL